MIVVELFVLTVGLYTAYTFLNQQRIKQVRGMLSAQVELLEKEVLLSDDLKHGDYLKPHFSQLLGSVFLQVTDSHGRVVWDSENSGRIGSKVPADHPLFYSSNAHSNDLIQFESPLGDEKFVGLVRRPSPEWVVMGAYSENEVSTETFHIIEKFIYIALMFCGFSFLLIVFISHRIVSPIRELTSAAQKISSGDFDIHLSRAGTDEIGVLSEAFSSMSERVRSLLRGESDKYRIKEEVQSVSQIQQSLLPNESIKTERYEIQSYYQSATETGGDYWGYFETPGQVIIYVADATGHGLSSAMLTAAARGCFSAIHRLMNEHPHLIHLPSELLKYANDAVVDSAQDELNMTMFIASYSFQDQSLTYASAGHNPAWILQDGKTKSLMCLGPRLGESRDFTPPEDQSVPFQDNDALVLYTDGLLDCVDESGEAYGKKRVKECLTRNAQMPLQQLRQSLIDGVQEHTAGHPLEDDITFALFKRRNE